MKYDIVGGGEEGEDEVPNYFSIGDLIELFLQFPEHYFKFVGTEYAPGRLHSWRGVYAVPAIDFVEESRTGSSIASTLKEQLGREHYGYKGGTYRYFRNDIPRISRYGCADDHTVVGYKVEADEVILLTKISPY